MSAVCPACAEPAGAPCLPGCNCAACCTWRERKHNARFDLIRAALTGLAMKHGEIDSADLCTCCGVSLRDIARLAVKLADATINEIEAKP